MFVNRLIYIFRTTVEQINNEIIIMDGRLKKIKKQIELTTTEEDIKIQMIEFMKVSNLYETIDDNN